MDEIRIAFDRRLAEARALQSQVATRTQELSLLSLNLQHAADAERSQLAAELHD